MQQIFHAAYSFRHSLILIRLLPDIAADIRAELRRRWERGEDAAARLVLDRVAIYGLLMLLAAAAALHACARAHPCPAVRLRRMIRPCVLRGISA